MPYSVTSQRREAQAGSCNMLLSCSCAKHCHISLDCSYRTAFDCCVPLFAGSVWDLFGIYGIEYLHKPVSHTDRSGI